MRQLRDVVRHRRPAAGVEPDLGVGQIVVVQQHEVRTAYADELGDSALRTGDVDLDAVAAYQAFGCLVVEADGDAMGPKRRVLFRCFLYDGERREYTALISE